jgi:hypothetical protein
MILVLENRVLYPREYPPECVENLRCGCYLLVGFSAGNTSPSVVNMDPDTCSGSASQLEGEQNFHVPCVGSEQYASPCIPQPSNFLIIILALTPCFVGI